MGRHLAGSPERDGAVGTTNVSPNLGHHQPVGRWFGRVEERITRPHIEDVVDAEVWVLEQVRGLPVDLERGVVVERIEIEQLGHRFECITNDYGRRPLAWDIAIVAGPSPQTS